MAQTETEREKAALKIALRELDGEEIKATEKKELAWLHELWFERHAGSISRKLYMRLSSKQLSQLERHSKAFGLPITGKVIDLFEVLRAMHQALSDNIHKIKEIDDASAQKKTAEARMIDIKVRKAELDLLEREGKLIDRSIVRDQLQWLASQFAEMSEMIGRNHGTAAQAAINGFLTVMQREVESGRLQV